RGGFSCRGVLGRVGQGGLETWRARLARNVPRQPDLAGSETFSQISHTFPRSGLRRLPRRQATYFQVPLATPPRPLLGLSSKQLRTGPLRSRPSRRATPSFFLPCQISSTPRILASMDGQVLFGVSAGEPSVCVPCWHDLVHASYWRSGSSTITEGSRLIGEKSSLFGEVFDTR